ncbi:MAG: hypothetical protein LBQ10_09855 [Desulfovibrio sp.]|nr:hypothetical protein [Desulfovibrio sp.]
MSVDATMAVLYAQTALATPITSSAAVAPQAALAMSRVLAAEMAKQEQQHVEKSEKTDPSRVADDSGKRRQSPFGSRRSKRAPRAASAGEDEPAPAVSPLVGNLLNMKV